MSDSIPSQTRENKPTDPPPTPASPRRRGKGRSSAWWLISIVVHALVLLWLFCFSPVHVIDLAKSRNVVATASPAKVREVAENIRQEQTKMLADNVRKLQQAQEEMTQLKDDKRKEFHEFKRDLAKNDA